MNSTIKPSPCKTCGSMWHSAMYHKPRKPIATRAVPKRTKQPRQQSDKEKDYQVWKEAVARPYLIEKFGNMCSCCRQYWSVRDTLDIEHTLNKGSHPELKRDLDNLTLMCRPCHRLKTDGIHCSHD